MDDPASLSEREMTIPFRFVHSASFPELLDSVGASLFVTTYQAGKLILFRAHEGRLSMLLRSFGRAVGLALLPDRMALATAW